MSIGIKAAKGIGYVGLLLEAASGVNNIYDACKIDSTGNCVKTTSAEIGGLIIGEKLATFAVGGTF